MMTKRVAPWMQAQQPYVAWPKIVRIFRHVNASGVRFVVQEREERNGKRSFWVKQSGVPTTIWAALCPSVDEVARVCDAVRQEGVG